MNLFFFQNVFAELRDPTVPQMDNEGPGYSTKISKGNGTLVVTAIFISGDKKTAIINDKVVKVGDTVEGKVVKFIGPYTVILGGRDSNPTTLYLFGAPVKENSK